VAQQQQHDNTKTSIEIMKTTHGYHAIRNYLCNLSICTILAGVTAFGQTFYSQTVTNDHALAYWNFDETNPTDPAVQQIPPLNAVNDLVSASGATRIAHAAIAGDGLFLGNAADLDGSQNFNGTTLSLGAANLSGPRAFEFWMQLKGIKGEYVLSFVSSGANSVAYNYQPNRLYWESGTGGTLALSNTDTTWHHVMFVCYGPLRVANIQDIYFDGVFTGDTVTPASLVLPLNYFVAGDYSAAGGLGFLGRLDEAAIYDLSRYTNLTVAQFGARAAALAHDHFLAATIDGSGVTVNITEQPADTNALVGGTAAFTVAATASGSLAYQWQKNWVDIPGATNASFTTPVLGVGDAGTNIYRARVSSGNVFVNSQEAALGVEGVSINISQQPTNVNANIGDTASFSVVASSTPPASLSYQWSKNGANIAGATNSSYTTPVLTWNDTGTNLFKVRVSVGAVFLDSDVAALFVASPSYTHTAYSQVISNDLPIAYWSFDEGGGNAIQQMPVPASPTVANDLIPSANATRVAHAAIGSGLALGNAADMDGASTFRAADLDLGILGIDQWGLEFWMQLKPQTTPRWDYILSLNDFGSDALIYDFAPNQMRWESGTGGMYALDDQDTNNWHHLMIVSYGALGLGNLAFYLDGELITTNTVTPGSDFKTFSRVTVGDYKAGGGFGYLGRLDELAIYDLSAFSDVPTMQSYIEDMVARHAAAAMAPVLSFTRAGNQLTLSWTGNGILQETASLSSPSWTDVPSGASSPVTVTIGTGSQYFSLRKP
jgi:hypothetical protein